MSIIAVTGHIGSGKSLVTRIVQYIIAKYNIYGGNIHLSEQDFMNRYNDDRLQVFCKEKKFADKLKDMVCLLINCTREQLEDSTFKNAPLGKDWRYFKFGTSLVSYIDNGFPANQQELLEAQVQHHTPRSIMQLLGTDCGRNIIHPQIWVNALMQQYIPNNSMIEGFDIQNTSTWKYPCWVISDLRFPNELKAIERHGAVVIRLESDVVRYTDGSNTFRNYEGLHESETALDKVNFKYTIHNGSDMTVESLIEKTHLIIMENYQYIFNDERSQQSNFS